MYLCRYFRVDRKNRISGGMQSYHRIHAQIGRKDRLQLAGMLRKGRESARVLRRASILRQLAYSRDPDRHSWMIPIAKIG